MNNGTTKAHRCVSHNVKSASLLPDVGYSTARHKYTMLEINSAQPPNEFVLYQTKSSDKVVAVRTPYHRFRGIKRNINGNAMTAINTAGMKKG